MSFTVTVTDNNNCQAVGSLSLSIPYFDMYLNSTVNNSVIGYPAYFGTGSGAAIINNQKIFIEGSFHINRDLTLNNCNILMADNAEIFVEHKKTLTLDRTNVEACSGFWDRIYLQTEESRLFIKNTFGVPNAIISKANTAVDADNKAFFDISDVTFQDNVTGIYVHNWSNTHPGKIKNTKFLNSEYSLYRGIWLEGANTSSRGFNLDLGGNTFENYFMAVLSDNVVPLKIKNCKFLNSLFGIMINNLPDMQQNKVDIASCEFSTNADYSAPGTPTGISVINVRTLTIESSKVFFNEIGAGININNSQMSVNPADLTNIKNCILNSCKAGIITTGTQRVQVNSCSLTNNHYGIYSTDVRKFLTIKTNTFTNNNYGVFATNVRNVQVSHQNVFNGHKSFTNPAHTAITVQNVVSYPTGSAKVFNNSPFTNIINGIKYTNLQYSSVNNETISLYPFTTGNPAAIKIEGCLSTKIENNMINGYGMANINSDGINVSQSPASTIKNNTITSCGNCMIFKGNCLPSTVGCNDMNGTNNVGLKLSTGGIIGQQGGTVDANGNTLATCPTSNNKWNGTFAQAHTLCDNSFGNQSPLVVKNTSIYNPAWFTGWNISIPSYLPSFSVYTATGCSNGCSSLPDPISPNALQQIAGNLVQFSVNPEASRWLGKQFVHRKLKKELQLANNNPILSTFFDSISHSNTGTIYTIENMLSDSTVNVNLPTATALNASILPVDIIEENYKTVQEIYIYLLANGIENLDPMQKQSLQFIAWQCPFTGGNSVYSSRVILSLIDSTLYSNDCEYDYREGSIARFSNPGDNKIKEEFTDLEKVKENFLIYPNPTNDKVFIDYNIEANCTFELFDILGNRLLIYTLESTVNQFDFSLINFSPGLYLYKIYREGKVLNVEKLTIIK